MSFTTVVSHGNEKLGNAQKREGGKTERSGEGRGAGGEEDGERTEEK